MPLKQILHAVELSRLPEPSPPAEGEAEAEAEAEEEEVPEVSEELISTPLPYRPLDFERFGALMAHSRYEAMRGGEGPSVVHVVNSTAEAEEAVRRWRGKDDSIIVDATL
jgi:hypothetical protein